VVLTDEAGEVTEAGHALRQAYGVPADAALPPLLPALSELERACPVSPACSERRCLIGRWSSAGLRARWQDAKRPSRRKDGAALRSRSESSF
jgi:hypothetical protein